MRSGLLIAITKPLWRLRVLH